MHAAGGSKAPKLEARCMLSRMHAVQQLETQSSSSSLNTGSFAAATIYPDAGPQVPQSLLSGGLPGGPRETFDVPTLRLVVQVDEGMTIVVVWKALLVFIGAARSPGCIAR